MLHVLAGTNFQHQARLALSQEPNHEDYVESCVASQKNTAIASMIQGAISIIWTFSYVVQLSRLRVTGSIWEYAYHKSWPRAELERVAKVMPPA
eukprot:4497878-Amphidinium_carterae.1